MELKDCFKEDFTTWLVGSNHPKMRQLDIVVSKSECKFNEEKFGLKLNLVREESLQEILQVLLREPLADYFWYGYPEYGGRLSYTTPSYTPSYSGIQKVPGDSLRVDGEKIKIFLRDYKIGELLK